MAGKSHGVPYRVCPGLRASGEPCGRTTEMIPKRLGGKERMPYCTYHGLCAAFEFGSVDLGSGFHLVYKP